MQSRRFSGSEMFPKAKQILVKIKFAPDTADDIGKHE
jgi:hypothetical protein